jgi:hypothetical protein
VRLSQRNFDSDGASAIGARQKEKGKIKKDCGNRNADSDRKNNQEARN